MGWLMLAVGFLGALWALFGKDGRSQAIAVFVVAYYAVLCLFGQPYDRYVLPLIPFLLFQHVQPGLKDLHGLRLILVLAPLTLTLNYYSRRFMGNTNSGLRCIDTLSAGPRRTEYVDSQIFRIDFDAVFMLVCLGKHGNRSG